MKSAPQIPLHSAKSPIVFINVEHIAKLRGLSINYTRRHFGRIKKMANVTTHGIRIDTFLKFSPDIPEFATITKEDFSRFNA